MKKRVFILSFMAVLVILWCGASWADDSGDPRDPESLSWDACPMPQKFDTSGDVASGLKPKIVWSGATNINAGDEGLIKATITNPVEEINVYIAAKDAYKLYGVSHNLTKDSAQDIPLTSADIKKYNIPFRVTKIVSSDNIATGDNKKDQSAKTEVTVAFNGGNFEYKNFPITISAANKNTGSKPVTKTVNINVTPNTDVPEWWVITSSDITSSDGVVYVTYYTNDVGTWKGWKQMGAEGTTTDYNDGEYKGQKVTVKNIHVIKYYVGDYVYAPMNNASGDNLAVKYYTYNGKLQRIGYDDTAYGTGYSKTQNLPSLEKYMEYVKEGYAPSPYYEQHGKYWYVGIPTTFYVNVSLDVSELPSGYAGTVWSYTSFDKKSKPEVPVTMYSSNGNVSGGSFSSETYTVKAPAPYVIQTKDFSAKGINVNITPPEFDYMGRNIVSGSVTLTGTLTKKGKVAVPLTAVNPSTGRKTVLKVQVIGTLLKDTDRVAFTKARSFTFDTSILSSSVTSDAYILASSDVYSQTRSKIVTKKVAMPKAPSAKFSTKGAKPITYKLGLYDADGNPDGLTAYYRARSEFDGGPELWDYMYGYVISHDIFDDFAEEYNASLVEKLTAHGLSFDEKKGKLTLAEKKGKTTPTLDEDKENLEPIDVAVTAINILGAAQAWAEVVITGEKPKLYDKSVTISGKVSKGQIFSFDLAVGKTIAKNASTDIVNIKSYTQKDADTNNLSEWGLELVNYDNLLVASGSNWVRSRDVTRKNYGLIQVISPDVLAQVVADAKAETNQVKALRKLQTGRKINIELNNLGATTKAKLTISLKDDITSGDTTSSTSTSSTSTLTEAVYSVQKTGGSPKGTTQDVRLPEGEEPEAGTEAVVTRGAPRTAADLTAAQRAYIAEKGYRVVAVLPEITSSVEGQQDMEAELDDDAPEGAKLIYLPFPNEPEVEDDRIADFYDETGAPIDKVPESNVVVVDAWLRAGVTYAPVIAVEE